jgi:hypothetical protein
MVEDPFNQGRVGVNKQADPGNERGDNSRQL